VEHRELGEFVRCPRFEKDEDAGADELRDLLANGDDTCLEPRPASRPA
jgi:hypothetical protein